MTITTTKEVAKNTTKEEKKNKIKRKINRKVKVDADWLIHQMHGYNVLEEDEEEEKEREIITEI